MRLFELEKSTFYLACREPQHREQTVEMIGTTYPLGAFLEGRLEATRPDQRLSRQTSLYLNPHPSISGTHVYEVVPIEKIERYHTAWLQKLEQASFDSVGEIDHFCKAYWSGNECPEMRALPWEYRTSKAKVIGRVGGSALTRPDGSLV